MVTKFITKNGKKIPIKRKEIVVDFYEEQQLLLAQKNPKNIGRTDHDLLVKIESAQKELRKEKEPERKKLLQTKIKRLENKKTIIRSHLG